MTDSGDRALSAKTALGPNFDKLWAWTEAHMPSILSRSFSRDSLSTSGDFRV